MQMFILPKRPPCLTVKASGPLVRRLVAGPDEPRAFTTAGGVCHIEAGEGRKLPTFAGLAYSGAPMRPAGWWGQVIIDLAGVKVPSPHRPALRQHDHEQIVGHTTSVEVTRAGIEVAGVLSGEKAARREGHHARQERLSLAALRRCQPGCARSTWKPAKPPRSTAAKSPAR